MKTLFTIFFFILVLIFFPKSVLAISSKADCDVAHGVCGNNYACPNTTDTKNGFCSAEAYPCCIPKETAPPTASSTASFDYTPLETIPGQGNAKDLPSYLTGLYTFGLGAVGIAALLMAIVGGYFYVTSAGNTSRVSKGKELITDAILGIVVAFCAWLMLHIINPDLVSVNLESLSTLQVLEGGDPEEGEITDVSAPNTNTPNQVPGGSCGGMRNQVGNQCKLASSALTSMLTCMKENGDTGIVTSVTAGAVGDNLQKSQSGCTVKITHAVGSCHFGCASKRTGFAGEPGLSHAIDYGPINGGMSDAQLCAVAERAHKCGSGTIWGPRNITCQGGASVRYWPNHGTHFHISTAACNH